MKHCTLVLFHTTRPASGWAVNFDQDPTPSQTRAKQSVRVSDKRSKLVFCLHWHCGGVSDFWSQVGDSFMISLGEGNSQKKLPLNMYMWRRHG